MSWPPFGSDGWEEDDGEGVGPEGPSGFRDADGAPGRARRRGEEGEDGLEPEDEDDLDSGRWPLAPRGLYPRERWQWWEQLWTDACMLRDRYRLLLRSGWWEDSVQVEALAALAAWIERYDSGEWDDPPGKLALLYDLERVSNLLRDGMDPFFPARDRNAFLRYLLESGAQPPPQAPPVG